eukprot:12925874-Prorocentrum_lima.AAC.1
MVASSSGGRAAHAPSASPHCGTIEAYGAAGRTVRVPHRDPRAQRVLPPVLLPGVREFVALPATLC